MELALYGPRRVLHAGRAGRPAWRLPHVAGGRAAVRCRAGPLPRRRVGASRPAAAVHGRRRRRRAGDAGPRDRGRRAGRAAPVRCATSPSRSPTSSGATTRPASSRGRTFPPSPIVGVVIANELLDNLPFRLAVFDGAWREAFVTVGDDGRFAEVLSAPFDPLPAVLPATAAARRTGAARRRCRVLAWTAPAAWSSGRSVVVFDYAVATTAELAVRPWREWLRTYRRPRAWRRTTSPTPATQDITTEVPHRPAAGADERLGPRPSSCGGGASTSSSTRGARSGPPARRSPISPRWPCAAGSVRPRRCSIRPVSAPSPSPIWRV